MRKTLVDGGEDTGGFTDRFGSVLTPFDVWNGVKRITNKLEVSKPNVETR
jgi:hypothetical protein